MQKSGPALSKLSFRRELSVAHLLPTKLCEKGTGGVKCQKAPGLLTPTCWPVVMPSGNVPLPCFLLLGTFRLLPCWVRTSHLNSSNREELRDRDYNQGTLGKSLTSVSLHVLTCKMGN